MARDVIAGGNSVDVGDVTAVDHTGTLLTASCWFYPHDITNRPAMGKGAAATTTQYALRLAATTSQVNFIIGDAAGIDTAATAGAVPAIDTWYHLAGRKNGTGANALAAFLNGVRTSVTSNRTIQNLATAFRMGGAIGDTPGDANGAFAECALWNVALSDEEILALAKGVTPTMIRVGNLRGYWPCLGLSASVEASLAPLAGGNGTVVGTPPVFPHPPVGRWKLTAA